jgi:hypothetical protein
VLLRRESHKEGHYMGRRRRLKRRLKARKSGRDARPERFVDVRVERNPKGRSKKSARFASTLRVPRCLPIPSRAKATRTSLWVSTPRE